VACDRDQAIIGGIQRRGRLDRQDDFGRWAMPLRQHLDANGGQPANPRRIEDPTLYNAAGDRICSLRA
jgi:hypothetical protein